jgi:hypothetical protein
MGGVIQLDLGEGANVEVSRKQTRSFWERFCLEKASNHVKHILLGI